MRLEREGSHLRSFRDVKSLRHQRHAPFHLFQVLANVFELLVHLSAPNALVTEPENRQQFFPVVGFRRRAFRPFARLFVAGGSIFENLDWDRGGNTERWLFGSMLNESCSGGRCSELVRRPGCVQFRAISRVAQRQELFNPRYSQTLNAVIISATKHQPRAA